MIFDGPETKSGRHFEITVSQPLVPYLDIYLREVRTMFPGADRRHRALWASRSRRPLTANAIARVISDRTCAAFGQPVSPHLFRHCAATTVATLEPGRRRHLRCRNYQPGVLRLNEATIGPVVFKKRRVFNSIQESGAVQLDTAITAP